MARRRRSMPPGSRPAIASGWPFVRMAMRSVSCGSSGFASPARGQAADVGDQLADVLVAELRAERRHAGPSDRGATVLDQVEGVALGLRGAGREIARPDEKEG